MRIVRCSCHSNHPIFFTLHFHWKRPVVEVWCMKSLHKSAHHDDVKAVPEKVLDSLPLGACELCRQRHQLPTFIINDSLLGYGIKDQRLTFLPPIGPLRQLARPGLGASSTLPLQVQVANIGNIGARAQYIAIHQYTSIRPFQSCTVTHSYTSFT